jgi:hypothetical protein
VLIVAWAACVAAGMQVLWSYKTKPGPVAEPPALWPAASAARRIPGMPALVMLAHPQCPCTRASLGELAQLMSRFPRQLAATVLFIQPDGVSESWTDTDNWRLASAIPGVTPLLDEGGVESTRFGAATSGQVVVYDAAGRLLFSGGITGARGHVGDNAGRERVTSLLEHRAVDRAESPVFGCPLRDGPTN